MNGKAVRSVGFLALAVLAGSRPASAEEYIEGVNDTLPVDPRWLGADGQEIAFLWTSHHTFDLTEIRWHSTAIELGATRLRVNDNGRPGPVLRSTPFKSAGVGWAGKAFKEPFHVEEGESYFVTFHCTHIYTQYLAKGGENLTWYWTENGVENWNGPFTLNGNRMIQFYGLRADCGKIERFKASCAGGDLTVKVKSTLPKGLQLTLDNDGKERAVILNRKGRGSANFRNQSGAHNVRLKECPDLVETVECG